MSLLVVQALIHYAVKYNLELLIFLLQLPQRFENRCEQLCQALQC